MPGNYTSQVTLRIIFLDLAGGAMVKNPLPSAGDVRDAGWIPRCKRSSRGGHGNPLSVLAWRIPMDRGAWWVTVGRVTKSRTRLKWLSTHMHVIQSKETDVHGDYATCSRLHSKLGTKQGLEVRPLDSCSRPFPRKSHDSGKSNDRNSAVMDF